MIKFQVLGCDIMGAIGEPSNKESVFWTEEALFVTCLNSSVFDPDLPPVCTPGVMQSVFIRQIVTGWKGLNHLAHIQSTEGFT